MWNNADNFSFLKSSKKVNKIKKRKNKRINKRKKEKLIDMSLQEKEI